MNIYQQITHDEISEEIVLRKTLERINSTLDEVLDDSSSDVEFTDEELWSMAEVLRDMLRASSVTSDEICGYLEDVCGVDAAAAFRVDCILTSDDTTEEIKDVLETELNA